MILEMCSWKSVEFMYCLTDTSVPVDFFCWDAMVRDDVVWDDDDVGLR